MSAGRSRNGRNRQGGLTRILRWVPLAAPVIAGVALFATGCGITTGPTQEFPINEPLGAAAVTDVQLSMGAGKLSLSPGATGLISGTIRYNVPAWKPVVSRTDSSLVIKQGSSKGLPFGASIVNDWQLQLGPSPMRLKVSAGAYEGTYDLSGLVLQGLSIKDGAAKVQVVFNSPNPGQMDSLQYETGASTVAMLGLANANFKSMDFKGGAGSYTLDFSGQLRTDAAVHVKAGVGTLQIVVPAQTVARVTVAAALTNVSTQGQWTINGKLYSTSAAGTNQQSKGLTITVDMSVGSLKLITQ